ncbi:hypothetical protein AURDEDRAFT_27278, partial [Auricularia subglabra TFB-10046 SS5]
QYARFERIPPGYYGERGSRVLLQSILTLYPPSALQPLQERFAPLSIHAFVDSVLVREMALVLIMEDLKLNRTDALEAMRASGPYGSVKFPDD